jgi:predicted nucleotidyltransferase
MNQQHDGVLLEQTLRHRLEITPLVIAETGSRSWGTHTDLSDFDFTVIGIDKKLDLNTYPRATHKEKFPFTDAAGNQVPSDVQFFSLEKALRLCTQSNLPIFEVVGGGCNNLNFKYNNVYTCLQEVCHHYFDAREMFRSCVGSLHTLKKQYEESTDDEERAKRKRQIFRYVFTALQLELGVMPKLNIQDYISGKHDPHTNLIVRMYEWAFFNEPELTYTTTLRGLFDHHKSVDVPQRANKEKQHNKYTFANNKFAEIHTLLGLTNE